MKLKISRLVPLFITLSFIMLWGIFNSTRVNAASTDLYFPETVLAYEYNPDGSVEIKNELVVYAHNNGVGYNLGDDGNLRVSKITVQVGNTSDGKKEYSIGSDGKVPYVTVTNGTEAIGTSKIGTYGSWKDDAYNKETKYVGKIVININAIMKEIGISNVNDVSISISFQRKGTLWESLFGGSDWTNYDFSVNAYKGTSNSSDLVTNGTGAASVKYSVTNSAFANSKLRITGMSLSKIAKDGTTLRNDVYNIVDYGNGKNRQSLMLTMKTNFAASGQIKACYSSGKCATLNWTDNVGYTGDLSSLFSLNKEEVLTFNSFTFSGVKDSYGSSITTLEFNSDVKSISVTLDTIAPSVTSAGVSDKNGKLFYDTSEIYPILNLSEDVTYKDLKFKFDIGGVENEMVLDDNENTGDSVESKISKTVYLSGNGLVKLKSFAVTITDKANNETTYTYNGSSSLCNDNKEVTLVSSIGSASVAKKYYYDGETIEIEVTLVDSNVNLADFSSIYLTVGADDSYVFTGYSKEDNIAKFSYHVGNAQSTINSIIFEKVQDNVTKDVYKQQLNIGLNVYLDLQLEDLTNPVDKTIALYTNDGSDTSLNIKTFDASLIEKTLNALSSLTCNNTSTSVSCDYDSYTDGSDEIVVKEGAIVLNNGIKNNEQTFDLIVNERNPYVSYTINSLNVYEYENKNYYKYGNGIITLNLDDGYGQKSCLYYKTNDSEVYSENCVLSNSASFTISLPQMNGEYVITYYTSDGENEGQEDELEEIFVYRGAFEINDIVMTVNGDEISNVNGDSEYTSISVHYENAKKLDLLKEFKVSIESKGISKSTNLDTSTILITKNELNNIDDLVEVSVLLTDMLGNTKQYLVDVNIDTILPSFENVEVSIGENDSIYTVIVSNYAPYEVEVKVDGVTATLTDDTFTTDKEKFTVYLTDKAGNVNSKVFTTVSPYIELFSLNSGTSNVTYEINISPFDSSIHIIEDYRYLVFDYLDTISEADIAIAKSNVCTSGRKVNCYIEGNFTSNNNLINQTFARGYSYVLLVKINNVLANLKNSSDLPRIDVVGADVIAPVGSFLDDDINPDYISSVSGRQFKFSFTASDINLTDKYYYLVVKSTLNMNINKFYELYSNCYGAVSSSNSCGIKGTNSYVNEVSDNTRLGEVIIEANNNTRKRLDNDTMYSLYVLILDNGNNETLFKVREFANVSESSVIEYKNDNNEYVVISEGEVSTDSTSEVRISKYNEIEVESVSINGENITCSKNGCNYVLVAGKHTILVTDVLGNTSSVVIYSAIASKPIIQMEYLYQEKYYKLSDSSYSYNTSNTNVIYVKVSGNNLTSVTVAMGGISKVYQSGSELFDSITSSSNIHGITLYQLISLHYSNTDYDGIITLSVSNSEGGNSSISMQVDNVAPEITLGIIPGSNVNLLGTQYTLNSTEERKYDIAFNYNSDITYAYLLESLMVKVDGVDILDMLDINRLNIGIDEVEDLYTSITKGSRTINIDYFDNAGNVADTVTITAIVIDDEKPVISLRNALDNIELNVSGVLAEVIATDNHDQELEIVATIDGETINYKNYKFLSVGKYVITYSVKDSSNNEASITQTIIVKDTTAPVLVSGTITNYDIGLNSILEFNLPEFVDSDGYPASKYYPDKISVLDPRGNELDSTLANYPLSYDESKVRIRFANGFELGIYKVVFVAKDNQNNAAISEFEIELKDISAPVIYITINGNETDSGSINIFPFGSHIIVEAIASDSYDGDLTSNIRKTITLNGKVVENIDTSVSGDYLVEFKVKDSNNNESTESITIRIANDTMLPNIDKVFVNNIEIFEDEINRFNGNNLTINVEASDDSNQVTVMITIDNLYEVNNGNSISVESGLVNHIFTIKIDAKDSSDNVVTKMYEIIVDNVKPNISGVNYNQVYNNEVSVSVFDDNIKSIEIFKDGVSYASFTTSIYSYKINGKGTYQVVAKDIYENESSLSFAIIDENKYVIVDENNNTKDISFDTSILIEARVTEDGVLFFIDDSYDISKNDQIYILTNYPGSDWKYVAYSMNGETYNNNSNIFVEGEIIGGVNNSSLLEKIGDKYYAHAMIIKEEINDTTANENQNNNSLLGQIIMAILGILAVGCVVIIIIKVRGRVRAA